MTRQLVVDARELVSRAFGGLAEFSCLTGSSVTGRATATSDVDIVVVLSDGVPTDHAVAARDVFTRGYVRLHRAHGRRPDLTFPGEVLFRSDLCAAVEGRCFAAGSSGHEWCAEAEPYRYWVSMVAIGIPLTGQDAFEAAAEGCADIVCAGARLWDDPSCGLDEIGIDSVTRARCPRLNRRFATPSDHRLQGFAAAGGPPVLEAGRDRWQHIAGAEWRRLTEVGRAPTAAGREPPDRPLESLR